MPTLEELQASDDAYNQATISQNNAAAAHAALSSAPTDGSTPAWDAHDARNKPPENTVARWMMNLPQNIGTSLIDVAVNAADTYHSIVGWADQHRGRMIADAYSGAVDATSNAMTSASNAVSAAVGQKAPAGVAAAPPEPVVTKPDPVDPVYDYTRSAVMALRDHLAVQDPNTADDVTQGLLKVLVPAIGFSRFLSGLGVASKLYNMIGTDALTGGITQGAHDPRMADMLALGRHVERKYIGALNTADDSGGLLNYYIDHMTDRSGSDGENRLKNALDFVVGGTALAPLFHVVPQVLKQGMGGLATAMDAGIGKTSDVFRGPAYQRGAVGADLKDTAPATLGKDDKVVSQVQGDKIDTSGLSLENPNTAKAQAMLQGNAEASARTPATDIADAHNEGVTDGLRNIVRKVGDGAVTPNATGGGAQVMATKPGTVNNILRSTSNQLSDASPRGAFYKDIYSRLADKVDENTRLVPPGTPGHAHDSPVWGSYSLANDSIMLSKDLAERGKGDPIHTLAHEAAHSVFMKHIENSPVLQEQVQNVARESLDSPAIKALKGQNRYGISNIDPNGDINIHEFMAEWATNPKFQQALKDSPSSYMPGKSLHEEMKKLFGGVLGLSAAAIASPYMDELVSGKKAPKGERNGA